MRKILLRISASFFAALFLLSGYKLTSWYLEGRQRQQEFDQVEALLGSRTAATGLSGKAEAAGGAEEAEPSILPEYLAICEANSDFVGWISIEGTKINYPVMQTPDDPDHYLKRSFEGEYSVFGTPYMQSNCDILTSDNLIIYGHSMKNGSMFTNLKKYRDQDFCSEHKYIQFDTKYSHGTYEVVAVFATTVNDGGFLFNYFVDAQSSEDFDTYIAACKALTPYDIETTAAYGDKLITLATCEYTHANGRMVVVAKQIDDIA